MPFRKKTPFYKSSQVNKHKNTEVETLAFEFLINTFGNIIITSTVGVKTFYISEYYEKYLAPLHLHFDSYVCIHSMANLKPVNGML